MCQCVQKRKKTTDFSSVVLCRATAGTSKWPESRPAVPHRTLMHFLFLKRIGIFDRHVGLTAPAGTVGRRCLTQSAGGWGSLLQSRAKVTQTLLLSSRGGECGTSRSWTTPRSHTPTRCASRSTSSRTASEEASPRPWLPWRGWPRSSPVW